MFDTINRNSWHWKLYIFNLQMINAWMNEDYYYDEEGPRKIGLCPYMRTIFIWGPLIMATNMVPYAAVVFTLVYFPTFAVGIIGPIMIVSGLALFFALMWCLSRFAAYRSKKRLDKEEEESRTLGPERFENDETFWKLIKDWIKTRKSKVCPIMEVR